MDQTITLQALLQCGAIIAGIFGSYKVVMEIIKSITARHDREQAWDKAVKDIEVDRETLQKEFNGRLDDQDAKFQQLLSMLCISLIYSLFVIVGGLLREPSRPVVTLVA